MRALPLKIKASPCSGEEHRYSSYVLAGTTGASHKHRTWGPREAYMRRSWLGPPRAKTTTIASNEWLNGNSAPPALRHRTCKARILPLDRYTRGNGREGLWLTCRAISRSGAPESVFTREDRREEKQEARMGESVLTNA